MMKCHGKKGWAAKNSHSRFLFPRRNEWLPLSVSELKKQADWRLGLSPEIQKKFCLLVSDINSSRAVILR